MTPEEVQLKVESLCQRMMVLCPDAPPPGLPGDIEAIIQALCDLKLMMKNPQVPSPIEAQPQGE